jgi:hypothetical protein
MFAGLHAIMKEEIMHNVTRHARYPTDSRDRTTIELIIEFLTFVLLLKLLASGTSSISAFIIL